MTMGSKLRKVDGRVRGPKSLKNSMMSFTQALADASHIVMIIDLEDTLLREEDQFSMPAIPGELKNAVNTIASHGKFTFVVMTTRPYSTVADSLPPDVVVSSDCSQNVNIRGMAIVNPSLRYIADTLSSVGEAIVSSSGMSSERVRVNEYTVQVNTTGMEKKEKMSLFQDIKALLSDLDSGNALSLRWCRNGIIIQDASWDKARMLELLLVQMPEDSAVVYIGDDSSDEPAFKLLNTLQDSWTVVVMHGKKPTAARYYLDSVEDVFSLLLRITELIEMEFIK